MEVARAFAGSIPSNYDDYLGPILFEPYARDLAERIPAGAQQVLELACGTGRVTRHLLKSLPAAAHLIASDLNPDMLAVAQSKIHDERVEWKVVDAQALPFADNTFDLIVCQFGVMFFPDKPQACAGIHRALKPGGLFLFNTWGSVATNPYAEVLITTLRDYISSEGSDFLERIPHSYNDSDSITQLLTEAGFRNIILMDVTIEGEYRSASDLVTGYLDGSPMAMFLNEHPEKKAEARERITAKLSERYGDINGRIPMHAIVASATK